MKLRFNGNGTPTARTTPTEEKVRAFLDKSPDGELFDTYTLSAEVKVSAFCIKESRWLRERSRKIKGKRWFGNPRTLKQLDKEMQR